MEYWCEPQLGQQAYEGRLLDAAASVMAAAVTRRVFTGASGSHCTGRSRYTLGMIQALPATGIEWYAAALSCPELVVHDLWNAFCHELGSARLAWQLKNS